VFAARLRPAGTPAAEDPAGKSAEGPAEGPDDSTAGFGSLCVYKPAAGERPLWDFPGAILAKHEVAAFQVSELLGWDLVPPTVWREDLPAGPGIVQQWLAADVTPEVAVCAPDEVPAGWLKVLRGEDEHGQEVVLAHRNSPRLAQIALFDVVINNADRKAGHLLGSGESIRGIDHGVAFHPEWKVRTVLWGFAGSGIPEPMLESLGDVQGILTAGDVDLAGVGPDARLAMLDRIGELLHSATFPTPRPGWPVVPWPLW
jgi:uncharacterized repeat protein (TIGR03843 family)